MTPITQLIYWYDCTTIGGSYVNVADTITIHCNSILLFEEPHAHEVDIHQDKFLLDNSPSNNISELTTGPEHLLSISSIYMGSPIVDWNYTEGGMHSNIRHVLFICNCLIKYI